MQSTWRNLTWTLGEHATLLRVTQDQDQTGKPVRCVASVLTRVGKSELTKTCQLVLLKDRLEFLLVNSRFLETTLKSGAVEKVRRARLSTRVWALSWKGFDSFRVFLTMSGLYKWRAHSSPAQRANENIIRGLVITAVGTSLISQRAGPSTCLSEIMAKP